MKRLHQITNALPPQTEDTSGIEALARISRFQLTEGNVMYPKTQIQSRTRMSKRQFSKRQSG